MSNYMRLEIGPTPLGLENEALYVRVGGRAKIQNRGRSPVFMARNHMSLNLATHAGIGFRLEPGATEEIVTAGTGGTIGATAIPDNHDELGTWFFWTAAGRQSTVFLSWDFDTELVKGELLIGDQP